MDLQQLSAQTGLAVRKLRYCLDHDLIPGLRLDSRKVEVGRARRFSADAGFGIVCAALLQGLGLPHPKIRLLLKQLVSASMSDGSPVLQSIMQHGWPSQASFDDLGQVRIEVFEDPKRQVSLLDLSVPADKKRRPPANARASRIIIQLDLGAIWQDVFTAGQ